MSVTKKWKDIALDTGDDVLMMATEELGGRISELQDLVKEQEIFILELKELVEEHRGY